MRASLPIALLASLLIAAPAAAAPTWLPPTNLESGLTTPPDGDVAVTADGIAVAVWVARVGANDLVRARVRLPGQGFGPVQTLTPADGRNADDPGVAVDAQGNATIVWDEQQGPGGVRAVRATRVPAGSVSVEPVKTLSNPVVSSTAPVIGVGAGGTAVVAYTEAAAGKRVRAATRTGGSGDFGAPVTVSEDFTNFDAQPVVGVDDDGDAVVAWQRRVAGRDVIEANAQPRGGAFGSILTGVTTLSNGVLDADRPALAMAPDGTTLVLWSQTTTGDVRYNERMPAGAWLPEAKTASPPGVGATAPAVGIDAAGNAVAAWIATSGPATFVQAGLRPAGGAFGGDFRDLTSVTGVQIAVSMNRAGDALVTFSGGMAESVSSVLRPRGGSFTGVVPVETRPVVTTALRHLATGIDDEGNATALWSRNIDPAGANTYELAAGALDAAPPKLTASVPSSGTVGTAIGMAAAATDRLSPVSIAWSFGDGTGGAGGAVTHAFGSAGAFTVTATATDAVGNASSAARSLLISPAVVPPPPATPRVRADLRATWGVSGKRIYLLRLSARPVPKGGKLQLRCKGKQCPFKRKSSKKRRNGAITLFKEVKASKVAGKKQRSFRARQRLEVRITAPGHIGKVVRYTLKKGKIPSGKNLCLPIGKTKPRARC